MSDELSIEPPAGGTPPAPTPAAAPPPATRVVGHNGGEIPEERVSEIRARERRKFNKENYGTEDEDEVTRIKAKNADRLQKAEQLEAAQEKARLDNLSEVDRLKEELRIATEKHTTEKARLESQLTGTKTELEVERQDIQISGIGGKYIAPKFMKTAKVEFGEYVDTLTKKQVDELGPKQIDKWFRDYAKENPEFVPKAVAAAKTPEEIEAEEKARKAAGTPPKRAPIGAPRGALPRRSVVVPAQAAVGKNTYKGKAVKDMTRAELAEFKKSKGMKPGW